MIIIVVAPVFWNAVGNNFYYLRDSRKEPFLFWSCHHDVSH